MTRPRFSPFTMFVCFVVMLGSVLGSTAARPTTTFAALPPASCAPLSGSATIKGKVTDSGSAPLSSVLVRIFTAQGDAFLSTYSQADGTYTFSNLVGGSYLLRFEPQSGSALAEWYNDQTSATTATPVAVAEGGTTSGVDVVLGVGARFSGTVTAPGGAPLQNVQVEVLTPDGEYMASASTNPAGAYTTQPGVPAGNYRIQFGKSGIYLGSYYDNKSTLEEATLLTVAAAELRTGINAQLAVGGHISGKVINQATGTPVSGAQVQASNDYGSSYDYTDASGNYVIDGLMSGAYDVSASSPFGMETLIGQQRSNVVVNAPDTTTGVDFSLETGGSLSGTVTGPDGSALDGITVYTRNEDGSYQEYTSTNISGVYKFTGLPSGTYEVTFRPSNYVTETYNDHQGYANPDLVTVTAPNDVTGIDAQLAKGSKISGKVTDAISGEPIPDVFVEVLDLDGGRFESTFTQDDGTYETYSSLPTGDYLVRFNADERFASCAYVTEYYNGKYSKATADHVRVTAPTDLTNIDATMERGSIISGRVTDAVTGAPITDGSVTIYDETNTFVGSGRLTINGGWHSETAVPSGNYRIKFSDYGSSYIDEYYNNKPTFATADPVVVTAPTDVFDINAALDKGGIITGTATLASTAPFTDGYVLVYDNAGNEVGSSSLNSDGSYSVLDGLATGSYRVGVFPWNYNGGEGEASMLRTRSMIAATTGTPYSPSYYRGSVTLAGATPVEVTAPTTTSNINIVMQRGTWLPLSQR